MKKLLHDSDGDRLQRMRHHANFLKERGYLRSGLSAVQAVDVLWTSGSPEPYELLVLRRGWSLPRFARFVGDFMIASLLPEEAPE